MKGETAFFQVINILESTLPDSAGLASDNVAHRWKMIQFCSEICQQNYRLPDLAFQVLASIDAVFEQIVATCFVASAISVTSATMLCN